MIQVNKEFYDKCQLTVMGFKYQPYTGAYICSCETIGTSSEVEPAHLVKTVPFYENLSTIVELLMTNRCMEQSAEYRQVLATIINKKEGREYLWSEAQNDFNNQMDYILHIKKVTATTQPLIS